MMVVKDRKAKQQVRGKRTFSSQTFCFPLGPGRSVGVEMCSVFHYGCGGKREREAVVKTKKAETQAKGWTGPRQ